MLYKYIILIAHGDNMLQNIRENWAKLHEFSTFIILLINAGDITTMSHNIGKSSTKAYGRDQIQL